MYRIPSGARTVNRPPHTTPRSVIVFSPISLRTLSSDRIIRAGPNGKRNHRDAFSKGLRLERAFTRNTPRIRVRPPVHHDLRRLSKRSVGRAVWFVRSERSPTETTPPRHGGRFLKRVSSNTDTADDGIFTFNTIRFYFGHRARKKKNFILQHFALARSFFDDDDGKHSTYPATSVRDFFFSAITQTPCWVYVNG